MRSLVTDKIKAKFEEFASNTYEERKVTLLKNKEPSDKSDFPPFCITYSYKVETDGDYINDEICTWSSNARVAIEEYAFYYGKLFTKRSKK